MEKRIVGYQQDEEQHWMAELECGHHQHLRHQQAEFADLERIPKEWKHLAVIEDSNPQVK